MAKESRATHQHVQEMVREHCDNMWDDVSRIYSRAELNEHDLLEEYEPPEPTPQESFQGRASHYEPTPSKDDPFPPPGPDSEAPLPAYEETQMLPGLEGVLGQGRGIVNKLLSRLQINAKTEQLEELYEWFESYTADAEQRDSAWKSFEQSVNELDERIDSSLETATDVYEDFEAKKEKVKDVMKSLQKVIGGNGISAKADRKRRNAQQMAKMKTAVLEEAQKHYEAEVQDLANLKKEAFNEQLQESKREKEKVNDLNDLQADIEKRRAELEMLSEQADQQGQYSGKLHMLVDDAWKRLRSNEPIESSDINMETLVRNTREEISKKPKLIRQLCPGIQEAENKEKEHRTEAMKLDALAADINGQAAAKEDVLELMGHQSLEPGAPPPEILRQDSLDGRPIAELKAALVACISEQRQMRGQIDLLHKKKKAILEMTQQCEDMQKEVRHELSNMISRVLVEGAEEEQKLLNKHELITRLPSSWQKRLGRAWEKSKQDSELYALMMLANRARNRKFKNVEREPKPASLTELDPSRVMQAVEGDNIRKVLADVEAQWMWQTDLQKKLTPIGPKMDEMHLLEELCLFDDLDSFWQAEDEKETQRMADLRALRHDLHREAKSLAEKVSPDLRLQQVIQLSNSITKSRTRAMDASQVTVTPRPKKAVE
eukprot:CAMPEP_0197635036 /NCGR_PEP_ID=MMETSP1338-20131121/10963_1 /TAXON_ID=43686 ORGANISM="Pelagodinium beii, Strain RCC1491" /NCGR_SAMPLE_ID=MMETSP1338 /ASSEMBLY_ACC=CAM_ASM_000754 /LENGTH=660 /DNA_ID=CAMNT_0043207011 /DNA_START=83 /DNA_END=2065 /DNA_ORIENTATION=+